VTLRFAIAGAGQIGRVHAARIATSDECRLVALVDPAPAVQAAAQGLDVPLFGSIDEMLAAARPDGVILATPNGLHVAGALSCIAAGVPVLVEKPIADTLADAQTLVDAQRRTGVPVLVGHHRRHSAIIETARQVIASGRLGRLVAVSGSATFVKPDRYFEAAPWRTQAGGGPILINLVHEIDTLRTLIGEITTVQALASSAVRGFAVEDTVAIGLRFESGVLGSFLLSDCAASPRSWEQTCGENPDFDHHADQDCCVIVGTHGSLQLPTMNLLSYPGERSWFETMVRESLPQTPVDPLQRQLAHFCAVVRRETEPLVSADDALRTLAATLAVADAARTGQAIELT
jgi:predicted dehydrogenase